MNTSPITTSEILDHITAAVQRALVYGNSEISSYFVRHMGAREKIAFDLFLVAMQDPLAWEAGTPESRFVARVTRMADLERERRAQKEAA